MIVEKLDTILKNTKALQEKIGVNVVKQMFTTLCEIAETKQENELTKDPFSHAYIRTIGDRTRPTSEESICQFLYGIYVVQGCFVKLFAFGIVETVNNGGVDYFQLTEKGKKLYNKIKLC